MSVNKLQVASWWIGQGLGVIPIQPNTKRIMRGFGIHQRIIADQDEAREWFDQSQNNMAVVSRDQHFILDFDDYALYAAWARSAEEVYTQSYTEYTPRGAHVFLCGDVVQGLQLLPGVEIKRVALVYPSVVDGKEYASGAGDIYSGDVDNAFLPLSKSGAATPYLLRTRAIEDAHKAKRPEIQKTIGGGPVAQIKKTHSVVEVFMRLSPTRDSLRGSGRWQSARCPFHKDGKENNASFWIDDQRGTWGCHSCGAHGDVINLYARFTNRTVNEVVKIARVGGL